MSDGNNPEFLIDMKIPEYIFYGRALSEEELLNVRHPKYPVLVFVNSNSGGRLGGSLLKACRALISDKQVFDLIVSKPDDILHDFLGGLEKLKRDGDKIAKAIQRNLRIIVAGGDGTAGWLLGVVADLKLPYPLPVATIPLGTGNNLPFSFGWGKKNPATDLNSVMKILSNACKANPISVDSWHVIMKMGTSNRSLAPEKLPHSLHRFQKVSESDALHEDGSQTFRGGFWNYFSIGMDAQVAYEFHKRREDHPERFKNQTVNQGKYAMISVTQGWFLADVIHGKTRNINQLVTILIQDKKGSGWKKLKISERIRSIVLLNLPSFAGGFNPWGNRMDRASKAKELTPTYVNDGLIEIVGFRDGWHGLSLLTPNGHGTRLAQAHKIRMEFQKGHEKAKEVYLRMDGEPWLQPLPEEADSATVIEISQLGKATILGTDSSIAQKMSSQASPVDHSSIGVLHSPPLSLGELVAEELETRLSDDEGEDDTGIDKELRRKFGAANTFKIQ